jgi:hypothetical protein
MLKNIRKVTVTLLHFSRNLGNNDVLDESLFIHSLAALISFPQSIQTCIVAYNQLDRVTIRNEDTADTVTRQVKMKNLDEFLVREMINCRSTDDYIDIHQKRNTVKVLMLES